MNKLSRKSLYWAGIVIGVILAILVYADFKSNENSVGLECIVHPWYKYRPDHSAGREITLQIKDRNFQGKVTVQLECDGQKETTVLENLNEVKEIQVLLPAGCGEKKECQAQISILANGQKLHRSVMVPARRHWTVYIYPHSHVDIGYTNKQEIVEKIHVRNIDVAIDLARKSQNNPEGSRFVWNTEAGWVVESYLKQATPEKKAAFFDAVRRGWIRIDGNYANTNTSACSDEELLQLFKCNNQIAKEIGVSVKTMVQFDVPGASWGVVPAAVQNGIQAFFCYPNHFDRVGTIRQAWEHKPFYWVGPDGKSKILFLQGCPYGYAYQIKGKKVYGIKKIQTWDPALDRLSSSDPSACFIDPMIFDETAKLEAAHSPYDIFAMTWAMADNCLIDADLPEAARLWNEKYAYPKVVICGSNELLKAYEEKYASIIPEVKGDYTEYWTDGLGTDARRVGMNRYAKERLVQTETLWPMLYPGKTAPDDDYYTSWRYVLLGAEHTWGYKDPKAPLAKEVEGTKASYFENAAKTSIDLLNKSIAPVERKGTGTFAVVNTLSWKRNALVTLTAEQSHAGDYVTDWKGNAVPSQRLSTGELVFQATDVPAFGSSIYHVDKGKASGSGQAKTEENSISNELIYAEIDPATGDIKSLKDLQNDHELVNTQSSCLINSYRYLHGADDASKAIAPVHSKVVVKEKGALVHSLLVTSDAEGCNSLKREIRLIDGQPWIELDNTLDKISTQNKEGVHFGFAFNVPEGTIRMDIPWGVMIPESDQLPGGNRNWLAMQRWIDVSNNDYGVTWAAIESPLVELGKITANILGGAREPENWLKTLPKTQTIYSWALNNHWHTNFPLQQGGIIHLNYRILPHKAYDPVVANRFAMEQNRPLIVIETDKNPIAQPLLAIDNPRVFVSVLKQSDDGRGVILRMRSVSETPENVTLTWPAGAPKNIRYSDYKENRGEKAGRTLSFLPYGFMTLYMEW
jgi:alpha-mannosidase